MFSICTGSYDPEHAFTELDAAYTNKPPAGVAYRCSFRVAEAAHAIERITDVLAQELTMDPAALRFKNFIPADNFPCKSQLGWEYDSDNYAANLPSTRLPPGINRPASRERIADTASDFGSTIEDGRLTP